MPRFDANLTFLWNEVPFLDRFAEAARAGFRAVEFMSPYDYQASEVASRARMHKLEVVLFNAAIGDFARGERGVGAIPGREHDFAAEFTNALRYAKELACPRLHVMAGVLPAGAGDEVVERYRRTFVRNLREAAAQAAEQDVALTIEPINRRDIPDYFLTRQDQAHAIREEVGAANLKVQMDFYHCQIVEGDLTEKFRQWQPHIGHVQIANVPGRHEPDQGEIDYAHIFRMLDERKYEGWVGCEYKPKTTTAEGLSWLFRLIDPGPGSSL